MPKITAARIAVTALILVSLTGCTSTDDGAGTEPVGFANVQQDATPMPEPLVAETPGAESTVDEADFLAEARSRFTTATQIPDATDEQLIEAGWAACAYLEAGNNPDDLTVIEGETRNLGEDGYFMDSAAIATAAVMHLCTDVYN